MTLQELINRTRTYTRDFTGSIYREVDILIFMEEAYNRFAIIPEFSNLVYDGIKANPVPLIPYRYQHLLPIYASSRCFFQDEQDYRAGTLMNEFETKLEELKSLIESGDIIIKDADGIAVVNSLANGYVVNEYFDATISDEDAISHGVM